jgi:hypothetical protein
MSVIEAMTDASVAYTTCGHGPGACSCWSKCWCGWTYERDGKCGNDHGMALALSRRVTTCACGLPFAKAAECAAARNLKTRCRCACHRTDVRRANDALGVLWSEHE